MIRAVPGPILAGRIGLADTLACGRTVGAGIVTLVQIVARVVNAVVKTVVGTGEMYDETAQ